MGELRMCGIAGVIQKTGNMNNIANIIRTMTQAILHRGPDGEGVYHFQNVSLGHRRLSILDLTQDGQQPMSYQSGQFVITYNGEIYNYIELRQELESLGYQFSSRTDTEVILAAYAAFGVDCVKRFNGMWAFAILDKIQNHIFCSRDRFGIKPFYYIDTPDLFAFGSEIKQLLPFQKVVSANKSLLTDFILTGVSDHKDTTYFDGVFKLPASHNLVYSIGNNRFTIKPYYQIIFNSQYSNLSFEDAIDIYMHLLEDAIKLRLRADVTVGTCLSGGLDSSSIASIAAPLYRSAFNGITAISEQESNNEAGYAKQVIDFHNMQWLQVKPDYADFVDSLSSVVQTQEEPFGSPSITMQYFVMKTAREHDISVLLDGQGGDEILLGYEKYYGSYLVNKFYEQGIFSCLKALKFACINNHNLSLSDAMKYLIGGTSSSIRYLAYRKKHAYLQKPLQRPAHLSAFSRSSRNMFQLQRLEIESTNLPVLLRYEDKNSMAHSIETRLPFLDHRVTELALSLPNNYKINDGWSKWLLRKGMRNRMPESIVWRKNKLGFEAPESIWLEKHFNEMYSAVQTSPLLSHVANAKQLNKNYPRLDKRSQWRLYSIAMWEKTFGISS